MRRISLLLAFCVAALAMAQDISTATDTIGTPAQLGEVVVEGTVRGNYTSQAALLKTETISRAGLAKMACCTVAESFENSAAVTVGYSDAVSGARQIKLLGLAGAYTQLLDESRPMMRGLAATYALDYTPGDWLRSIQVAKGVSSVPSGHEAITGQINLEYRRPTDEERLHVNCYLNDMLRPELNLSSAWHLTADKRLSTIVLAHGSLDTDWREMGAMDRNHDGFRDQPAARQVDVANRWLWLAPGGLQLRWGARFTADERTGGQLHFHHNPAEHDEIMANGRSGNSEQRNAFRDYVDSAPYGTHISNREASAYVKVALPVGAPVAMDDGTELMSNMALIADFAHFETVSYFGLNDYRAHDNTATLTIRHDHHFSPKATLAVGAQGRLTSIGEQLSQDHLFFTGNTFQSYPQWRAFDRREREVGAFAEWTQYLLDDRLTLVAGVREDYNSLFRRWSFTPRGHVKWTVAPRTTLRLSGGTGFRSPNPISDNLGMLATGYLTFIDDIGQWRLERAVNFGGSLSQSFTLGHDPNASVSVDWFRTQFSQTTCTDQEGTQFVIRTYLNEGRNYSDTWQLDFNWSPIARLDVLATFRYTNSKVTLQEMMAEVIGAGNVRFTPTSPAVRVERPLVHRYKGVLNVSYATKFRRWVFDFTAQLNGPARIPTLTGHFRDSSHSPAYATLFAQVTHKIGRGEVYAGCENITDYRQQQLIVGSEAPFLSTFNASRVWGPVMGRRFYVGLRWNVY